MLSKAIWSPVSQSSGSRSHGKNSIAQPTAAEARVPMGSATSSATPVAPNAAFTRPSVQLPSATAVPASQKSWRSPAPSSALRSSAASVLINGLSATASVLHLEQALEFGFVGILQLLPQLDAGRVVVGRRRRRLD